jgi:hypothetical protein
VSTDRFNSGSFARGGVQHAVQHFSVMAFSAPFSIQNSFPFPLHDGPLFTEDTAGDLNFDDVGDTWPVYQPCDYGVVVGGS